MQMRIPNVPINGLSISTIGNAVQAATTSGSGTPGTGLINTVTGFIKDNPNLVNTATGLINQYTGTNIPTYGYYAPPQTQQQNKSDNTMLYVLGGVALLVVGYKLFKD
jgi:hypothetical protein